MPSASTQKVIDHLRFGPEIVRVRKAIREWVAAADPSMRTMLEHQFCGEAKYFRPLTVFSCHRAVSKEPVSDMLVTTAQVVEMFHNVSLIIDDIVDGSEQRRGKDTMHHRFGPLKAYMVSGYIINDGFDILARQVVHEVCDMCCGQFDHDEGSLREAIADRAVGAADAVDSPGRSALDCMGLVPEEVRKSLERAGPVRYDMRLLAELLKRLAVAECVQWDSRKHPLGLCDWYVLAREDTGSMFEVCAALGARTQRLRRFGRLLGMLYHGCDDVADVRKALGLGGGGEEDLEEGILTLPAALAIEKNKDICELFCKDSRTPKDKETLRTAFYDQLGAAEGELDKIRAQAEDEARFSAAFPEPLLALIDYVRPLSGNPVTARLAAVRTGRLPLPPREQVLT